jgi:hypothetical protein
VVNPDEPQFEDVKSRLEGEPGKENEREGRAEREREREREREIVIQRDKRGRKKER